MARTFTLYLAKVLFFTIMFRAEEGLHYGPLITQGAPTFHALKKLSDFHALKADTKLRSNLFVSIAPQSAMHEAGLLKALVESITE